MCYVALDNRVRRAGHDEAKSKSEAARTFEIDRKKVLNQPGFTGEVRFFIQFQTWS